MNDQRYRAIFAATFGFFLNLMYAIYHGILGALIHSLWFVAMCAYYIMLGTMRFSAILCEHKHNDGVSVEMELFVMKLSGMMLALLSLVLAIVTYISLSQNIAAKYGEIIMITIATYTFGKITLAIRRAIKQRTNPSPLLVTIRSIGYAEGAASVLTLQRSMLASFGAMDAAKARILNAATGAAVCGFVLALGIALLTKERRNEKMANSKLAEANEKIAEKVVGTYKTIEDTVVNGYTKIEDAFVDRYLTKDGETVEEAKKRMKGE